MNVVKFTGGCSPSTPNLGTREQVCVADECRDGCKVHTVREGSCGSKEKRRVCLILGRVNDVFGCKDPGGVIGSTSVVDNSILGNGQVVGIPYSRIMKSWRNNPDKDDNANTSVGVRYTGNVSMFSSSMLCRFTYHAKG